MKLSKVFGLFSCFAALFLIGAMNVGAQEVPPSEEIVGTSTTSTLTVQKTVKGGPLTEEDFSFSYSGQQSGSISLNTPVVLPPGSYSIFESTNAEIVGGYYQPSYSGCAEGEDGAFIEISEGQDAMCVITNTFVPDEPTTGTIEVCKNVVAGDNQIDIHDSNTFYFDMYGERDDELEVNGNKNDFSEGHCTVFTQLRPGNYTIEETYVPDGYEVIVGNTQVNVEAGATTSVTLVNKALDICPNIEGVQGEVPEGYKLDQDNWTCYKNPRGHSGGSSKDAGGNSGSTSNTGQVLGESTTSSCSLYIKSYLRKGFNNPAQEVIKLQTFLNNHLKINLPVTGFFGPLTEDAVKQFQKMYASEILEPWTDLSEPSGIVYKTTLAKINSLMCSNATAIVPTSDLIPWSLDPTTPKI